MLEGDNEATTRRWLQCQAVSKLEIRADHPGASVLGLLLARVLLGRLPASGCQLVGAVEVSLDDELDFVDELVGVVGVVGAVGVVGVVVAVVAVVGGVVLGVADVGGGVLVAEVAVVADGKRLV